MQMKFRTPKHMTSWAGDYQQTCGRLKWHLKKRSFGLLNSKLSLLIIMLNSMLGVTQRLYSSKKHTVACAKSEYLSAAGAGRLVKVASTRVHFTKDHKFCYIWTSWWVLTYLCKNCKKRRGKLSLNANCSWYVPNTEKSWRKTGCKSDCDLGKDWFSNKTRTANTQPKLHRNNLETIMSVFWSGQVRIQTSTESRVHGKT